MADEEYLWIGSGTHLSGSTWGGPVIATRDMMHFVLKPAGNGGAGVMVGGILGGAVGGAIAGAIASSRNQESTPQAAATDLFSSLPEKWRQEMGRKLIGRAEPQTRMLSLRKEDVARVWRKPWYRDKVRIDLRSGESIQFTVLGLGVNKKLLRLGWPVS